MKRAVAALALMAWAVGSAAQPSDPLHAGDPSRWGRVLRWIEPEFPRRAFEERRSGYVEVRGRVGTLGVLEDIEYSAEDAHSGVFIDPIRRVIAAWEFEAPLGRDCQPSEQTVANRVWFEARDGKPVVRVVPVAGPHVAPSVLLAPRTREEPVMPPARAGDRAIVYTRLIVDHRGRVVSVEPHGFARRGTPVRPFEHEVIRALTHWTFAPAGRPDAQRRVCITVRFGA